MDDVKTVHNEKYVIRLIVYIYQNTFYCYVFFTAFSFYSRKYNTLNNKLVLKTLIISERGTIHNHIILIRLSMIKESIGMNCYNACYFRFLT